MYRKALSVLTWRRVRRVQGDEIGVAVEAEVLSAKRTGHQTDDAC